MNMNVDKPNQILFRLVAYQPLSITLETVDVIELQTQNIPCRFILRPAYNKKTSQQTHGGTFIVIDYQLPSDTDPLQATRTGLYLIEDLLSGISLVQGVTFSDCEPIQCITLDPEKPNKYVIAHFINVYHKHWSLPISVNTVNAVRHILAHWDGLDSGKRLRRAARQFRRAIGIDNVLDAFQHAYMGLEAVEKPLADTMNITAGYEEIKGKCEKCGAEYIRRRTLLAGVRSYVCGSQHPGTATSERERDWKTINKLRQDIFHSLEDNTKLEKEAGNTLTAGMHYLHDAICCLSHAHELENPKFLLVRGTRQILFIGDFNYTALEQLEEWHPVIEIDSSHWVSDKKHGLVPRCKFTNHGAKNLGGVFYWLNEPLESASMKDLVPANWKLNQ